MPRVILQPFGNKDARDHFNDTIKRPVSIEVIAEHLPSIASELKTLTGKSEVPMWGVTPGKSDVNRSKWNRVQRGDVVLFAREGAIRYSAVVITKEHSRPLATKLWNSDGEGNTWEYLYFLGELAEHNIPMSNFNAAAGYAPNFVVQGFNVLDEEKSAGILGALNLFAESYIEEVDVEEFYKSLTTELDTRVWATARKEQAFLRRSLFKEPIKECAICGKTYPIEFLVAAHIKKRSECSIDEKRDYRNIVVPMCKFGCDALYEKGYIAVSAEGRVINRLPTGIALSIHNYAEQIENRFVPSWNEVREKYFAWHRQK